MSNQDDQSASFSRWRRKAEEKIRERSCDPSSISTHRSAEETQKLLYELQVHQIELEMQNEELQRTQDQLNAERASYFTLYELAPVGYVNVDHEGLILKANLAAATILDTVRKNLLGQSFYQSIYPEDQDIFYFCKKKLIKTSQPQVCELRMVKKNGTPFWVSLTYSAAQFEGDLLSYLIVLSDITERVQQEEEGRRLQKQLSQAQKMEAIGTLAGGIAHDFNNILGAIFGYAEMVHEDCLPNSVMAGDIEQIIIAGNRAKELVKQILAFSRQAEADNIVLQPAIIVKEIIKLLRATLPTTIDIKQNVDSKSKLIAVDPTQIHQVLMNLCTNAFHAMEETGGTLDISLRNRTLEEQDLVNTKIILPGDFVQLSVKDSGPGISPEIKARMFDPYFTTKTTGKGTGLGLAIVHGIISSYKGFIRCDSKVGEGTTFDIFIPTVDDHDENVEELDGLASAKNHNEHILFVDDEEPLALMNKIMLERLGYRVTVRTTGFEALTTFRNDPDAFDLVITDQTMPGITGFDLARRMLQIRPQLPIILCTGFSTIISEEKTKSAGIKGFAMKPLAKKEIVNLISTVLSECP